MEAVEHFAETLRTDRQHGRQADRRIHGISAADPVPETEHVRGVDAEFAHAGLVGRDRDEVPRHRRLAQRRHAPFAGLACVGQGFLGGEGLGADDEQRARRIQPQGRFVEIGRVDVGDETQADAPPAVVAQRLAGHARPQVRAADADVDHVADALAGGAQPASVAHLRAEIAHARKHRVHFGHDIGAIDFEHGIGRCAQRHVQRRPVLGGIDVGACEHGVPARRDATGFRQRQQQAPRLRFHPLLGVVQVPAGTLGREPFAASRVGVETLAQGDLRLFPRMSRQRLPLRARSQRAGIARVVQASSPLALSSIRCSNWFQDFTNDAPPSSCSCRASASRSTPAAS